jgi:DnaJ-class molecular chaperone
MKNLYKILGVDKKSSIEEIKKAYRKLALIHHPDKNNGEESQEFIDIVTAYTILKDKKKRKKYDKTGEFDTQVFDKRKSALNFLATIFMNIVRDPNYDPLTKDVFKIMNICIDQEMQRMRVKEQKVSEWIKKFELIEGRIKGKDSLFNDVLNTELRQQNKLKDDVNHEIEIMAEARKILKDYKYKTENTFVTMMNSNWDNIPFGGPTTTNTI